MASSKKPDFIDSKEKVAPVELTTGTVSGEASGKIEDGQQTCVDVPTVEKPSGPEEKASEPCEIRKDVSSADLRSKSRLRKESMRLLPGGKGFVALLVAVCLCGGALEEFRKSVLVDIASRHIADNPQGYVQTVGDLGDSYRQHHKDFMARALYDKAMKLLLSSSKPSMSSVAFAQLKLADLAFAAGDKSRADELVSSVLSELQKTNKDAPYELHFLLTQVSDQFEDERDYETAIKLNEMALDIWGTNAPLTRSYVKAKLGLENNRLRRFDRAENWLKESISYSLNRIGNSWANAWRFAQLGHAQIGLKKYPEALSNLLTAQEMFLTVSKLPPERIEHLAPVLTDLGRVYCERGDYADAEKVLLQADTIIKNDRSKGYNYLLNQFALANMYRDSGQFSKARSHYEEVGKLVRKGRFGIEPEELSREVEIFRVQSGGE